MPPPNSEFTVGKDEVGSRLETFLRKHLGFPRPLALKALRKGWIRVDGRRARGDLRLTAGQVVRLTNYALLDEVGPEPAPAPLPRVPDAVIERARASVRASDQARVVSAKPAGVVVHAGSGHDYGWADAVAWACGGSALVPVGRLDRDTSGLLVLGRGRGALRALFADLRADRLNRTYTALVAGALEQQAGRIELPLSKQGAPGHEQMRPDPAGEPAVTRYRVIDRMSDATLVEVQLETGRTHQIRAHFAALGAPLLGDPRYTDERAQALARRAGLERLFLHAGRLELRHPTTGEPEAHHDPLPRELEAALRALGGSSPR